MGTEKDWPLQSVLIVVYLESTALPEASRLLSVRRVSIVPTANSEFRALPVATDRSKVCQTAHVAESALKGIIAPLEVSAAPKSYVQLVSTAVP